MSSFRKSITVQRRQSGQWVNGRWIDGAVIEELAIPASIQPAKLTDFDQMQALLEGRRIEAAIRVYTDAQLRVAGTDKFNGDAVLWPDGGQSRPYRVIACSPWRSGIISHYRYLAVLEMEP